MKFWDSSAVVPLLVEEEIRTRLLDVVEQDPVLIVWWGTSVECASAIARREREGDVTVPEATGALERLRALSRAWNEVESTANVRAAAERLLRVHSLRTADALQLAAALIAAEHEPSGLEFISLDERLNVAAQREGFPVWTP